MYTLGIDIGSTTSKCVVLKDGVEILSSSLKNGGMGTPSPERAYEEALKKGGLEEKDIAFSIVTGYGRNRWEKADRQVSELSCHASGARFVFPDVKTIIDIGGQDAKVISLNDSGKMKEFLMNDKCAAGTGRFLDVMASILLIPIDEMKDYASKSEKPAPISSTCTVFAESEVISQLANGVKTEDLVAGICMSVASRTSSLVKRIHIEDDVCMSGGVAQNSALRKMLEDAIGHSILYSDKAQLFGAIGAAVLAYKELSKQ